jgi:proteasome accessory factor C
VTDAQRRLHHLLLVIATGRRKGGVPIADLARRLGVSVDEVHSYVSQAMMCGRYPFGGGDLVDVHVDGDRVFVHLDQDLGRPASFTVQEALALSCALGALQSSRGEPYAAVAASALRKIRARLTGDVGERVADLEHRFAIGSDDRGVGERFSILSRGVDGRRAVDLHYYTASRDAMSRRRVRPYLLVQHLGYWYLVAHDSRSDEERIFKVERVREAALTDERFEVPASFDATRYGPARIFESTGVRRARVRFRGTPARTVWEEWPRARLVRERDGAVVARLDFTHVEGMAAWLMSLGDQVEVLEPADLRRAVAARCRAALSRRQRAAS